ncbi:MAG: tetratricopeptide repeat protein [Myxococcales bacterium]|nr:tetratricopeptide repeat protein [Myxococcales bacterium]
MPNTCPGDEALDDLARGRLSAAATAEARSHARSCRECARKLARAEAEATRITDPALVANAEPADVGLLETIRRVPTDPGPDGASSEALPRGTAAGRYVILDRIGAGGMGVVYAAYDPDLDRKIALKVLRADALGSSASDEHRVRLLREAQAMAQLSHPNVVAVHDVGLLGGQVFVAMEFAEGLTLREWLARKPRSWRQVLEVFLQAGQGLSAAHAAGLTHRDFKPENVVVGQRDRVRVMDFGLAHAASAPKEPTPLPSNGSSAMRRRITQPGTMLGTPAYMSLEQLLSKPTDPRSDQFSFCVALYEALYGERPFAGETAAALAVEIQEGRVRPEPKDSGVPRRIRELNLRGLRANPAERFRTIDALLIGLGRRSSALQRRRILAGVSVLAAAAVASTYLGLRSAATDSCAQMSRKLAGVWDAQVRRQAEKAFLATGLPYAGKAFAEVERALDAYTGAWVTLRVAACEAGRLQGTERIASDEALGRRIVCLGRRLDEVRALTQLFTRADPEVVERAVPATLTLGNLSSCVATPPLAPRAPDPRALGKAEEIRGTLAAAKARLDSGKFADAAALAKSALDSARQLPDRGLEGEAHYLLGMASLKRGEARAAESSLSEAVLAAKSAGQESVEARAYIDLVGVGAYLARYDQAREWGRHARAVIDRSGGDEELEAHLLNNLGVLAWAQGKHDEAIAQHQRALALREKLLGAEHPLVAKSLTNIGISLKAQGRYDEALSHYRRAEGIEERALSPEHPAVAETLNNIGNVLKEQGEHEVALEHMRRALAIKEKAYGPEHLSVAITLNNIGSALADSRRFEEALESYHRALAIKEKRVGPDHPSVAASLTNLGGVQREMGKPKDALELYERALAIKRRAQGPDHPDLAHELTGIGRCQLDLGRPWAALAPLERALAIRERSATAAAQLGETRFALARALFEARKDPDRAQALARKAREDFAALGEQARDRLAEIESWLAKADAS